jgi:hypothetical protein
MTIVVVCHWGVIKALTGYCFENCEYRQINFDELLTEPLIPDK